MRALEAVEDLGSSVLSSELYDLALFSSGYEERARHIGSMVKKENCGRVAVVGFDQHRNEGARRTNDAYFAADWGAAPSCLSADDDSAIYVLLNEIFKGGGRQKRRILVDYSSMSRLWYSAVLNWVRFGDGEGASYTVDFAYSVGRYSPGLPPLVIGAPAAVPGFEGSIRANRASVAFFGLGFAAEAAMCVLDRLEPDSVYAIVVEKSEETPYTEMVWSRNEELLKAHAIRTLELPMRSVSQSYRHLAELVGFHRLDSDVALVPMGPKPHVLTALLVGTQFNDAVCLRVSGRRRNVESVPATGEVILTRVVFG